MTHWLRHPSEWLRASEYVVRPTALSIATELCERYHYARGCGNTAVYVHGLYRRRSQVCLAAVIWLPPIAGAARWAASEMGSEPSRVLMLSRSVARPEAPHNAMSFLIGASLRAIFADRVDERPRFDTLITYADAYKARVPASLRIPGGIYRATNAQGLGVSRSRPVWVDPATGRQVSMYSAGAWKNAAAMREAGYRLAGHFQAWRYGWRYDGRPRWRRRGLRVQQRALFEVA